MNEEENDLLQQVIEVAVIKAHRAGQAAAVEAVIAMAAELPGQTITHEQLLLFRDRLRVQR